MKFFQTISQTLRIGEYILWKILYYFKLALWRLFTFWGLGATPIRERHWIQNPNQNKKLNIISWITVTKFTVLSKKIYIYSL